MKQLLQLVHSLYKQTECGGLGNRGGGLTQVTSQLFYLI